MAENSKIEWTDHTFNPWIGCTAVSPACDNCYAEAIAKRTGGPAWGKGQPRRLTSDANWRKPLTWNRKAANEVRRYRVFCASLADVFDAEVPDEWRDRLFALIAVTPHLDWLLLTKRPKVAHDYLSVTPKEAADRTAHGADLNGWSEDTECAVANWINGWSRWADGPTDGNPLDGSAPRWPLPNLWLGTTVENQAMADTRIPWLLDTPAAVRFLSCEPLLGPVDLSHISGSGSSGWDEDVCCNALDGKWMTSRYQEEPHQGPRIDWVIAGGESGPPARPSHPDWLRSLRDQCQAADVPFFFKQWGEYVPTRDHPIPAQTGALVQHLNGLGTDKLPLWIAGRGPERNSEVLKRLGKARAGRTLDGRIHDAVPEV